MASLAVGALALVASACSADTPSGDAASPSTTTPALERAVTTTDFVPGEILPSTTAAPLIEGTVEFDAVAAYRAGVDALLAAPSVRVTFEGVEGAAPHGHDDDEPEHDDDEPGGGQDEYRTTGWVEMDLTTGDYRSSQIETYQAGATVESEYVLTGETIFIRFGHTGQPAAEVPWAENPVGAGRQRFVDGSLTMFGRAGASLDRITQYLENVSFEVAPVGPAPVDGRSASGYQVVFDSVDIGRYLRAEGLETVGPSIPDGSTIYEFWVDETEGHLARLAIGGVQFFDGEPLVGFGGELRYAVGGELAIGRPA